MQRLIVVGGGIGGLAAAWAAWTRLEERGATGRCEVVLLEAAAEPGGKAESAARDGWLVERGPTGFLSGEPAVDRLIDNLCQNVHNKTENKITKVVKAGIYAKFTIHRCTS